MKKLLVSIPLLIIILTLSYLFYLQKTDYPKSYSSKISIYVYSVFDAIQTLEQNKYIPDNNCSENNQCTITLLLQKNDIPQFESLLTEMSTDHNISGRKTLYGDIGDEKIFKHATSIQVELTLTNVKLLE